MTTLTYELLREATAGGFVALRSITTLQPAGGPGDKVFPPTYAVDGRAEHKYSVEDRQTEEGVVSTVLLDSVASQANRAELALLEGWYEKELSFPVAYVDFTVDDETADLGHITVLEAPHRIADAIFRDSLLGDTLFRLSDIGRAITDSHSRDVSALFRYSPTALLLGMWDSTGPKGGLGSKFQRAYVSEIVGLNAQIGRKVGSRIDPLQIERAAATAYEHADPEQRWTLDKAEAAKETKGRKKGQPKTVGSDGRPARNQPRKHRSHHRWFVGWCHYHQSRSDYGPISRIPPKTAVCGPRSRGRDRRQDCYRRFGGGSHCLSTRDGLRSPFPLSLGP